MDASGGATAAPGWAGPRAAPADAQPAAWTLSEWARVEAVPVGTKTAVQLHDDEAPPDSRRVTGRFHAATADTFTLTLEELTATSSTRTLIKSAVDSVSVVHGPRRVPPLQHTRRWTPRQRIHAQHGPRWRVFLLLAGSGQRCVGPGMSQTTVYDTC